ncbi:hypothetical protein HPB52_017470 [Rhipicephalus sanguineus]|uniref:Uncharacterized protein n=1 Tax=Rhipicephalus sanguineus TaxID=34632 RepID=A0A9D4SR96_RHISA|nr:hypothetical protein HPB52_017470 [Rhipicephalus sanguineus]
MDEFQKPVFPSPRDPNVSFLYDLLDWLDARQEKNTNACRLTDETHGALYQTTQALGEIARYCFSELHLCFVLLGKLQTDLLEDRFGKYRRLAGSHYHVSIRQLYESENKLRLQSTLPRVSTSAANHTDED